MRDSFFLRATHQPLFLLYMALLANIAASTHAYSGMRWMGRLGLYALLFVGLYYGFSYLLRGWRFQLPPRLIAALDNYRRPLTLAMHAAMLLFPVLYYGVLGYLPFLRMATLDDYYAASAVRHSFAGELPGLLRYLSGYYLYGAMPVWLVYCYFYSRRMFYLLFAVAFFFALNQVTKISFALLYMPLCLVFLAQQRFVACGALGLFVLTSMATISFTQTKPPPAASIGLSELDQTAYEGKRAAYALVLRAFNMPGKVITQWFETYPDSDTWLHGCGIRLLAALKGCAFTYPPAVIYHKYYPNRVAGGLRGTVTASHFMNGYVNFGVGGFLISAAAMALLIIGASRLLASPPLNFAFHAGFVIMATEKPLSILIHSGGWFAASVTILVFFSTRQTMPPRRALQSESAAT